MDDIKVARVLGWTSFGIAGLEVCAQKMVAEELLGIDDHPYLLPALGVREMAAGAIILSQKSATPTLAAGLWSRVAGDAVDLALLGLAATRTRKPTSLAISSIAVLGITALDVIYAVRIQRQLAKAHRSQSRQRARDYSRAIKRSAVTESA